MGGITSEEEGSLDLTTKYKAMLGDRKEVFERLKCSMECEEQGLCSK